jgi:hypothetical protein
MPLLIANSRPIANKPCGCHGGMGKLFRSRGRGLGAVTLNVDGSPPTYAQLQAIAVQNGVDPAAFAQAAASGADIVQLTLLATGGEQPVTLQSTLDTVNTDVGSSNYPATVPDATAASSVPGTPWIDQDGLGFGMNNGTYLLLAAVAFGGIWIFKK